MLGILLASARAPRLSPIRLCATPSEPPAALDAREDGSDGAPHMPADQHDASSCHEEESHEKKKHEKKSAAAHSEPRKKRNT